MLRLLRIPKALFPIGNVCGEATKYAMDAVLAKVDKEESAHLYATDTKILFHAFWKLTSEEARLAEPFQGEGVLIPASFWKTAAKAPVGSKAPPSISIEVGDSGRLAVSLKGGAVATCKPQEGRFPCLDGLLRPGKSPASQKIKVGAAVFKKLWESMAAMLSSTELDGVDIYVAGPTEPIYIEAAARDFAVEGIVMAMG